ESHSGEQVQVSNPYDAHHHRASLQHAGPSPLHEPPPHQSHHGLPQHYTAAHQPHPILTDPTHLAGHPSARHMGHPGPPHFGAGPSSHAVVAPLYPSLTPTHGHTAGMKRPRPDDLDLSMPSMSDLEHSGLESMQQTPMGAPYGQPPAAPPTHHHHRLPDTGPPSKLMRRDGESSGGGAAPSMVGQAGMPPPAPRPKGPKLKFTPEDDQLLVELKENKNLTWKQIADFFPGRSSGTLQVRYCTKLKAKTTQWTDETVSHFSLLMTACRTTRTKSGASLPTRLERALRRRHVVRGRHSC
ncbi:hypothetical protein N657DRAFT_573270, partial [Parathielavia appendiculata]